MGWKKEKKGTSAPFLLFSFLVSFFLVPVSTPFLRFHSLSPFVRFIPFEKHLVPQCVPRTTTSLMGEIQFAFFHSWHPFLGNGEPLLETQKHVAGPRNSAKIEDTPVESFSCVIRYRSALFCTDLRSTQILIFLLRVIWRTH